MTVRLDSRHDIGLESFRRVAWEGETLTLGEAAVARMTTCREAFLRLIAKDPEIVIYGVTTGYGEAAKQRLGPDEQRAFARRGMAVGGALFGDPLPRRVSRGIALARLANFLDGHAAVRPELAQAVAAQLNGEIALPDVARAGHGCSGEVLALYCLFAPIEQHLPLEVKEDGALVNGAPAAISLLADAALAAGPRLARAFEVFALASEAFLVPPEHFDPALGALWDGAADQEALDRLSALIAGGAAQRRPYQGSVSLRVLPRLLGQALRARREAEAAAAALAHVTDNPVFLMPDADHPDADHPDGRCLSTGGFHDARAAPAMDGLAATWADLALVAARLVGKLVDGSQFGLPKGLLPDSAGAAPGGAGRLAYLGGVAGGLWIEAREAASRTTLEGIETEGSHQNDIVAPAFAAWAKEDRAARAFERCLAILAVHALEALTVTGRDMPPGLAALEALTRRHCPAIDYGAVPRAMGPDCGGLAEAFRAAIFGPAK